MDDTVELESFSQCRVLSCPQWVTAVHDQCMAFEASWHLGSLGNGGIVTANLA